MTITFTHTVGNLYGSIVSELSRLIGCDVTSGHPFLDRLNKHLRDGIESYRDALEVYSTPDHHTDRYRGKIEAFREIQALVKETAANWLAGEDEVTQER